MVVLLNVHMELGTFTFSFGPWLCSTVIDDSDLSSWLQVLAPSLPVQSQ